MTIRETVAKAVRKFAVEAAGLAAPVSAETFIVNRDDLIAAAVITAFLEAAAEPDEQTGISWHMRPDEADGHMCNHAANIWREESNASVNQQCRVIYTVMTETAPKFKWNGK